MNKHIKSSMRKLAFCMRNIDIDTTLIKAHQACVLSTGQVSKLVEGLSKAIRNDNRLNKFLFLTLITLKFCQKIKIKA